LQYIEQTSSSFEAHFESLLNDQFETSLNRPWLITAATESDRHRKGAGMCARLLMPGITKSNKIINPISSKKQMGATIN